MCAFYPLNICLGTVNLARRFVDSVQTYVIHAQLSVTNSIWKCVKNVQKYVESALQSVVKWYNQQCCVMIMKEFLQETRHMNPSRESETVLGFLASDFFTLVFSPRIFDVYINIRNM